MFNTMKKLNIMNVSIEFRIMLHFNRNNGHCSLQIQLKIKNRKIYPNLILMADDPNVMKVLIV